MARLFDLRATPTDVVLRAVAIAAIVYNHTQRGDNGGGLAVLLLVSGMNFARFAIKDASAPGIRRSIVDIARQLFVPSMAIVLFSFAISGRFDLLEFLFIRNWYDTHRIAFFPVWYSQMFLQLLGALYVLAWIPTVVRATIRRPAVAMLALFSAGLLFRAVATVVWGPDTGTTLPHTLLWNFALGAAVYFLAVDATTSRSGTRWLAAGCVLAVAFVAYDPDTRRFWWLAVGGLLAVGIGDIPLPRVIARVTTVVSAASFGIFLTHRLWFKAVSNVHEMWAGSRAGHPLILWIAGVLLGTLTWAAFVAFQRAYRALRSEPAQPVLAW